MLASGFPGGAALVLLCLAVYLPGLASMPPVDRDESRFAQASRQMFESVALPKVERHPGWHDGGLVVPMIQDRPRLNKPPLIYWLQAASAAAVTGGDPERDAIWMYRVPSLAGAVAAVLLTWRLGVGLFGGVAAGGRAAWLGAALLAVSPIVAWEAHQGRADMLLLACTCGAMWGFWSVGAENAARLGPRPGAPRAESSRRPPRTHWRWVVLLWVCVGLGVLTKGPIVLLVVGLAGVAIAAATRSWAWARASRPIIGAAIVAAMVLPWVIAVAGRIGWGSYCDLIWRETVGRSTEPREGHWGPPGYHLVLLVVLFWPGVMMAGMAIERGLRAGIRRSPPKGKEPRSDLGWFGRAVVWVLMLRAGRFAELFLVAWLVPSWLVFEFVSTKLPHYTMPLYPAIALLTGRAVFAAAAGELPNARGLGARAGYVVWGLVGVVLALLPVGLWLAPLTSPRLPGSTAALVVAIGAAVIAVSLIVLGVRDAFRANFPRAHGFGVAAGAIIAAALVGAVIPNKAELWTSARLASAVRAITPQGGTGRSPPIAAVRYHEDSLLFLFRGNLERVRPGDLPAWITANPDGIVVAPPAALASALPTDPDALMKRARGGGRVVAGFNYSNGDEVELIVWPLSTQREKP